MLINFNEMPERTAPGMNNGIGEMTARMYMGNGGKIIPCRIHAGGSIGNHKHETSDDIKQDLPDIVVLDAYCICNVVVSCSIIAGSHSYSGSGSTTISGNCSCI